MLQFMVGLLVGCLLGFFIYAMCDTGKDWDDASFREEDERSVQK